MSDEPVVTCPKCGEEIKLTESLTAPMLKKARAEFAKQLKDLNENIAKRERKVREEEHDLAKDKENLEDIVADRMKDERKVIAEQEATKAKRASKVELEGKNNEVQELQGLIEEKDDKIAKAQKDQAELLKAKRELQDANREMDVNYQKRLDDELDKQRYKTRKEIEESQQLKMAEKDKQIEDVKKELAEAQRKLDQGSQQTQGEVLELDLERTLATKFRYDLIEPVPKGVHGGDIIQRVRNSLGQQSGTILWETKRTKNWSDAWLQKLRDDQRLAKADVAIIVSEALPQEVSTFGSIDGVLVVSRSCVIPVALVMRQQLMEVANARQTREGKQTKMGLVYEYLTGPEFRQRVEAIVEAFSSMHEDLIKEKKAITNQWAKREKQIEKVMQSTVGMWGDLQGIAGKTLQEIEGLDVKLLGGDEAEVQELAD